MSNDVVQEILELIIIFPYIKFKKNNVPSWVFWTSPTPLLPPLLSSPLCKLSEGFSGLERYQPLGV